MSSKKYQRLLPASRSYSNNEPSSESSTFDPRPPKRISIAIACDECRARKLRCDGARPICYRCQTRGQATCSYASKRQLVDEATLEVIELLMTLPQTQAFDVLIAWREHGDPAVALSTIKHNINTRGNTVALSTFTALESELMAKNSCLFPSLHPLSAVDLANSNLLKPSKIATSQKYSEAQPTRGEVDFAIREPDIPDILKDKATQLSDYCDKRLRHLKIGFWTDLHITNEFAARVISLYIQTDHPLLGVFDVNLFITGLVDQRQEYCSRFLIHAVMCLGCQMYSAFDPSAIESAHLFSQEAERLWELKPSDSGLTMAGLVLLGLSLMGQGQDHTIIKYSKAATEMGKRLGLLGLDEASTVDLSQVSEDNARMYCSAAWGTFSWTVLLSLFYRQPGMEFPERFPTLPIPWGSASLTKEERSRNETPLEETDSIVTLFPALCEFWQMIYEATWLYSNDPRSLQADFKLQIAEYKFREILAWTESYSTLVMRTRKSPHYIYVIHIWIHAAFLDIWRPFVSESSHNRHPLKTFSARDSTAEAAYKASVNQLKGLVVAYRTDYETSAYSILWHTGLLYLANAMLEDTRDPEWRSYFLLCLYGYESLRRPYRISALIGRGLLSMALRDTDMPGDEARKILQDLEEHGIDHVKEGMMTQLRATLMVDLNLAIKSPEDARVEKIAGEFDNLALFQDIIDKDELAAPDS